MMLSEKEYILNKISEHMIEEAKKLWYVDSALVSNWANSIYSLVAFPNLALNKLNRNSLARYLPREEVRRQITFTRTYDGWRIVDDESIGILTEHGIPLEPENDTGIAEDNWITDIIYTAPFKNIDVVFPASSPLPEPPTVGNECI
jgi:hypothetical protein